MNLYDQLRLGGLGNVLGSGNAAIYSQLAQQRSLYNNYAVEVCAKAADSPALPDKRILLLEDCE